MRIEFEGLLNARDLGGITGHGGKKIKMGRIIRSDNLSSLTPNDCEKLKSYGLSTIVDFRTDDEVKSSPDKEVARAKWIHCPILESLTAGITRKETKKASCLAEILLNFSLELGPAGKAWLASLYIPLVTDDFSLKGYRRFLDIMKDNKDGAVLYHCSAGKDRVGMGTFILLSALGVSQEDIIKDYLLTNESYAPVINEAKELGKKTGVDQEIIDTIEPLSGVDISYLMAAINAIEKAYGDLNGFFKNGLGIDEDYINSLRQNYLE